VRGAVVGLSILLLAACTSASRTAVTQTLQEVNKALAPLAVFKVETQ
jgi:hypothetical protein